MGKRFWEFYLVRYLLGTIFGIVILFYFVINYNEELSKSFLFKNINHDFNVSDEDTLRANIYSMLFETTFSLGKEDVNQIVESFGGNTVFNTDLNSEVTFKQTGLTVLAAIILGVSGFLYMYFSSMAILVLHGIRYIIYTFIENINSHQIYNKNEKRLINFYINLRIGISIIALLFLLLIIFILFKALIAGSLGQNLDYKLMAPGKHVLFLMIFILYVGFMFKNFHKIKDFYIKLAKYRSEYHYSLNQKRKTRFRKVNFQTLHPGCLVHI
ncbi:hypothetical protein ACX93W_25300 [Paenibacillus sp. CAU 1782]